MAISTNQKPTLLYENTAADLKVWKKHDNSI